MTDMTAMETTMNENVYCAPNGAEDTKHESEEKMFTQSQLEEIIRERLSRERKVNESLNSVKTLLKGAAQRGLIGKGSYSEMAKDLIMRLGAVKSEVGAEAEKAKSSGGILHESNSEKEENAAAVLADSTVAEGVDEASQKASEKDTAEGAGDKSEGEKPAETGIGTEIGNQTLNENANVSDNERETEIEAEIENGKASEKGKANRQASFAELLCDIKSRYTKQELEKLLQGDLFERFAKGRSTDTRELIDDFFEFISLANPAGTENENGNDRIHSGFASTAFSSQSGTPEVSANLTKQQMEIAKSAGMSYREYQNLLQAIPQRTKRSF